MESKIVTNRSPCIEDIQPDVWAWITDEDAKNYGIITGDDLSGGYYRIASVENPEGVDPSLPDNARPALWVLLREASTGNELLLVLNSFCQAILASTILVDPPFLLVIDKLDQLKDLNSSRYTCIGCSGPLNIISTNLRICVACEATLEPEEKR
jgi:hypothetical protein